MMSLPYDKYSWNLTQHAIGLKPDNLFPLLSAASLFENQSRFGDKINEILIAQNVLTSNIRNGKPDAWRDYQQILSETGLIYSTKIERSLRLTEAGRLLLQGEIGFSELMSIQSLRYQYPNGLKSVFLTTQLQSNVLIKPGTLLLRILIELSKNGRRPAISIDQCQNFVLPITKNKDWIYAYEKLGKTTSTGINKHARRNIQDWFKFLNTTSIFNLTLEGSAPYISLSEKVLLNIKLYETLCSISEDPASFWIPPDDKKESLLTWFKHFGHIPTEFYVLLESEIDDEFIKENYVSSPTEDVEESVQFLKELSLSEIGSKGVLIDNSFDFNKAKEKVNSGYIKRREKTKLHDEMVNILAKHYQSLGYSVFEDRNSIDLLVKTPHDKVSIFEVKTATPRNLFQRTRLAVGQILEYGYRYNQEFGSPPEKNIVLNLNMDKEYWLQSYMNEHLDIGLVSVLGDNVKSYPNRILKK